MKRIRTLIFLCVTTVELPVDPSNKRLKNILSNPMLFLKKEQLNKIFANSG